jgi:hypothetical protein
MLTFLLLAHLADFATFSLAVPLVGIEREMNPVARSLYEATGLLGPALLKVGAVGAFVWLLSRVRRMTRYPRLSWNVGLATSGGLALFGAGSNLLALS